MRPGVSCPLLLNTVLKVLEKEDKRKKGVQMIKKK